MTSHNHSAVGLKIKWEQGGKLPSPTNIGGGGPQTYQLPAAP